MFAVDSALPSAVITRDPRARPHFPAKINLATCEHLAEPRRWPPPSVRVPAKVHLFSLRRPDLDHRSRLSDFLLVGRWFKCKRSAARAPENPSSTPSASWWAQNETGQFAAGEQSLWSSYRRLSGCVNSQYATSACCEGGGAPYCISASSSLPGVG